MDRSVSRSEVTKETGLKLNFVLTTFIVKVTPIEKKTANICADLFVEGSVKTSLPNELDRE